MYMYCNLTVAQNILWPRITALSQSSSAAASASASIPISFSFSLPLPFSFSFFLSFFLLFIIIHVIFHSVLSLQKYQLSFPPSVATNQSDQISAKNKLPPTTCRRRFISLTGPFQHKTPLKQTDQMLLDHCGWQRAECWTSAAKAYLYPFAMVIIKDTFYYCVSWVEEGYVCFRGIKHTKKNK
jgi:hypothetical protein